MLPFRRQLSTSAPTTNLLIFLSACALIPAYGWSVYTEVSESLEWWKEKEEAALKKLEEAVEKVEDSRKAADVSCRACAVAHARIKVAESQEQAVRDEAQAVRKEAVAARKAAKARVGEEARKAKAARNDAIKKKMAEMLSDAAVEMYLKEKQNEIYASEICRSFQDSGDQATCAKFFREVAGTTPHDPWTWLNQDD